MRLLLFTIPQYLVLKMTCVFIKILKNVIHNLEQTKSIVFTLTSKSEWESWIAV